MIRYIGIVLLICITTIFVWPLDSVRPASSATGSCFSPGYARALENAFTNTSPSLLSRFGLHARSYRTGRNMATIIMEHDKQTSEIRIAAPGPSSPSRPLIYWPRAFSSEMKNSLGAAILSVTDDIVPCHHIIFSGQYRFWDHYANFLALLIILVLIFGVWALLHRLSREDIWLLPVIVLGAFALFAFTRPTVGDIDLHLLPLNAPYDWNKYGPGGVAFSRIVFRLFGENIHALFYVDAVFSLLTAIPLYIFVRDRFSMRQAGYATVAFTLLHPLWLRYGASELTHAFSLCFFFMALALLIAQKPKVHHILIAFFALAIAMLSRGEFFVLGPVALLLVGAKNTFRLLRELPRTLVLSSVLLIIFLLPHLLEAIDYTSITKEQDILNTDLNTMLHAALLIHNGNVFTNLEWSPWPFLLVILFGFLTMLITRPLTAISMWLATFSFFWNSYFLNPEFSSTHYQLPLLPIYAIFGAYLFGVLGNRIHSHLIVQNRVVMGFALLFGLFYISLLRHDSFRVILDGGYTFMREWQYLDANQMKSRFDCGLLYYRPEGDFGMYLDKTVHFPNRFVGKINLAKQPFPKTDRYKCLQYLRTPSCFLMDYYQVPRVDHSTRCLDLEKRMKLSPIWENTIPARPACGEDYTQDELPIGLYRVTDYIGTPVGIPWQTPTDTLVP